MKAFSGFTPNVLDITEKKSYLKTKKIKNISRIHHVKYNYSEAKTIFHAGQYSGISPGKKFEAPTISNAPKFEEKVGLYDGGKKFGFVSEKRESCFIIR